MIYKVQHFCSADILLSPGHEAGGSITMVQYQQLSAFIELSAEQKRSVVLKEGVALAKWDNCHYQVFLFQLPKFYVETFCNKKSKHIAEFRVIPSAAHLAPYLDAIRIDGLFE